MSTYGYMESPHSLMPEDTTPSGTVTVTREEINDLQLISGMLPVEGDTLRVDIWYLGTVPPTIQVDGVPLVGTPTGPGVLSFRVDASKEYKLGPGDVRFTRLEVCLVNGRGEVIPGLRGTD